MNRRQRKKRTVLKMRNGTKLGFVGEVHNPYVGQGEWAIYEAELRRLKPALIRKLLLGDWKI